MFEYWSAMYKQSYSWRSRNRIHSSHFTQEFCLWCASKMHNFHHVHIVNNSGTIYANYSSTITDMRMVFLYLPRNVLQMYSQISLPEALDSEKWFSSRFNSRLNCSRTSHACHSTNSTMFSSSLASKRRPQHSNTESWMLTYIWKLDWHSAGLSRKQHLTLGFS